MQHLTTWGWAGSAQRVELLGPLRLPMWAMGLQDPGALAPPQGRPQSLPSSGVRLTWLS